MSETNLTLVFDGPSVENGEIDVQDLAPALLAMGQLIQATNQEINGEKAHVSVRVKATAEGSFEVDLNLMQSLIENAKALFDFSAENKEGIAAAKDLAEILFKVTGGVGALGGGVFALMKYLKGRKPDKVENLKSGDIHIHCGDTYFLTNKKTLQVAESVTVRQQMRKYVSTLAKDGIDTLKVRRAEEPELKVSKEEIGHFDFEIEEEVLTDEMREMTLQIISLSFKEDNKWRVTDGGDPFNAAIEDTNFLNQIANNEISFSKGDYLICKVRERQFSTSKGLKKESTIIEVTGHNKAAQQLRLI